VWAHVLALAVICAVSPTAFLPPVVLLSGARGVYAVIGYALGQVLSNLVVAGFVFAGASTSSSSAASTTKIVVDLVAGLALVAFGFRTWRRRELAQAGGKPPPRWLSLIDRMGPVTGFLFGAFWINTVFAAAAGLEIAKAGTTGAEAAFALVVYAIVASGASLFVLGLYLAQRERARERLAAVRAWMTANQTTVLALFLWFAGGFLLFEAGVELVA